MTHRKPLLLRGARQVGKTFMVQQFGKSFAHCVSINFELEPHYKSCFEESHPDKIIPLLSALSGQPILDGETLLFLDEIQVCPRALQALRYFKELRPALHVIAAGSLIEFALHREQVSMPVGRVEYLYMRPCSFREYLENSGHETLLAFLNTVTIATGIPTAIHERLLGLFREYMVIGGMPEAMQMYVGTRDLLAVQRIHNSILQTYQDDFGKYASLSQQSCLQTVFDKTPGQVGQQISFAKFAPEYRSRELKQAMVLLEYAGVIQSIYATCASGLPLVTTKNEKKFKLAFLDIGLVQRKSGFGQALLLTQNWLQLNHGALAEQVVAQELMAYQDPFSAPELFFWARDQRGSQAEVDYVTHQGAQIVPIEVKSSATGHLRSLKLLMQERNLPLGIKVSMAPLTLTGAVLNWPIYLLWRLGEMIEGLSAASLSIPSSQSKTIPLE